MNEPLPRTRSCFVCGVANPLGLDLQFTASPGLVTARFCPRPEHIGFAGTVHGGLISTVLDEAMVWACGVATGRFAYCAELSVRFVLAVRPGEDLEIEGRLVTNRRDKLFEAAAELRDAHRVVRATATGKYLPVPAERLSGMLDDFVGDIGRILKA